MWSASGPTSCSFTHVHRHSSDGEVEEEEEEDQWQGSVRESSPHVDASIEHEISREERKESKIKQKQKYHALGGIGKITLT